MRRLFTCTPIVTASGNVISNGMGAARVSDVCGCGAVMTTGFPSVLVNGRALAHLGSLSSHGGTIVSGSGDNFGSSLFASAAGSAAICFGVFQWLLFWVVDSIGRSDGCFAAQTYQFIGEAQAEAPAS
ncbi:hypothetical protein PLD_27700 [Pseudomonas sp. LD120]|nr:hypothetical protein PLD_27700 [Pseudomonas sp. LD120]